MWMSSSWKIFKSAVRIFNDMTEQCYNATMLSLTMIFSAESCKRYLPSFATKLFSIGKFITRIVPLPFALKWGGKSIRLDGLKVDTLLVRPKDELYREGKIPVLAGRNMEVEGRWELVLAGRFWKPRGTNIIFNYSQQFGLKKQFDRFIWLGNRYYHIKFKADFKVGNWNTTMLYATIACRNRFRSKWKKKRHIGGNKVVIISVFTHEPAIKVPALRCKSLLTPCLVCTEILPHNIQALLDACFFYWFLKISYSKS